MNRGQEFRVISRIRRFRENKRNRKYVNKLKQGSE